MSTLATMPRAEQHAGAHRGPDQRVFALVLGRVLFGLIFIWAAPSHFAPAEIAAAAAHGVLFPKVLVPLSGLLSFLGGVSVVSGYRARLGAWLLILFLVPVTIVMHDFWHATNPAMAQMQLVNFMKNLSLLGGALVFTYFGAGPLSVDARNGR